jgi:hypothetical protein
MGAKMKLPISQDPISDMEIILAPGTYNNAPGDVTLSLQFRLESIPEDRISYYTGEDPIRIEGPVLRLGCEADPAFYTTRFELAACDKAGVDTTSFLAEVNFCP